VRSISYLVGGVASSVLSSLLGSQPASHAGAAANVSSANPFANLQLTAQQQAEIRTILQTAQSEHLSFSAIQQKIAGVLRLNANSQHVHRASGSPFSDVAARLAIGRRSER